MIRLADDHYQIGRLKVLIAPECIQINKYISSQFWEFEKMSVL